MLEEFTGDGPDDVRRLLAAVPLDGSAADDRGAVRELTGARHRFVTGARLSPDGRRAAWLGWDHPRMPWDGTELLVAEVTEDGRLTEPRTVAGGPDEAVAQVEWAHDGRLLYASDRSGWWNLYRDGTPLCTREEGSAGPCGSSACAGSRRWTTASRRSCTAAVPPSSGCWTRSPARSSTPPDSGPKCTPTLATHGRRVVTVGAGPRTGYEVIELDTGTGHARVVGARHRDPVDPAHYPEPRIRTFRGPDGRECTPTSARRTTPHGPRRTAAAALCHLGARRAHQPGAARAGPGGRLLHLARASGSPR